jgi:Bacterial Ig-like domain (group 1)/PKD domain
LTVTATRIPVNGSAEVIATVIEQAGTPPQNGTVVTFSATLGSVEPREARTEAGKAYARFNAGGQSGTARISAYSGEARVDGEAAVQIQVGGAAASAVALRADPSTVPNTGGTVTIVATVVDEDGNTLPGIPVTFSANAGQLSAGAATTDASGEARTSLTTNRDTEVSARAGAQTATFTVRAIAAPAVTISTTATDIQVGIPVNFVVAPQAGTNANALREVIVDFGDGTPPVNLGAIAGQTSVSHAFPRAGTFTVTATATDTQGLTGRSSTVVTVQPRGALAVTLTAAPNPVSVTTGQGLVNFTATVAGGGTGASIASFDWSFGDGGGRVTTGGTTTYRYAAPGTYVAEVFVRASNGQEGFSSITVRVTP